MLRRHARRHPSGSLSEERDALRIRALIELGRITEARDEAERFFAEHPRSLFRRGLEARLERATER
ncbi:MAG TPA: hypothetical protein RMH99_27830 [Sandaracinaceae bacterium LLY-WYZ-13_1]|nr:hypothetical protein [Sandaracinaceae bacterium LLY-WYZ-13_1]